MSYLVFARKYRPQSFDEVVGQEHVARTLQNAIAVDRLAHAYLFCGPRGVGKTTMARLLAKAVNCPDGAADMASAIAVGNDVDVIEIDAASNRKVEDLEPLIDATRYLPQRAPRKIFIVDEAHMLSKHAWNSLLKTLEEPPPHVLFIFATTEAQKVLETVRSRCQRFDFKRISVPDIVGKLRRIAEAEDVSVEEAVLEEIAMRATGGLRDAESLFDQALSAAPPDRRLNVEDLVSILGGVPQKSRQQLVELAHAGDMAGVLDKGAEIVDAGADPAELLSDLYGDLRDHAVRRARGQDAPLGVEWCLAAAEIVGRHRTLAKDSRAVRATLDLCLLAVSRLGDVTDLEDLVGRLEQLGAGAPAPSRAKPPAPTESRGAESPRLGAEPPRPKVRLEPRPKQVQNEPAQTLSGEEQKRIRQHPRVRAVLDVFGGEIAQVRRKNDG